MWGQGAGRIGKTGRLSSSFSFSGKIQVLALTPQGTGQMPEGTGLDPVTESAAQGHFRGPVVILLPSLRSHMDTCPPPIFIPEATKVQIYMMPLADFIPRDRSTQRLSDLPKGIY